MAKHDLTLNLKENALDSLSHALHHYNGSENNDAKYVVLHFAHAVELFLKARLELENYSLIYVKPEDAKKPDGFTIDLNACIGRLAVNNVILNNEEINDLKFVKKMRNSIEHHFVEIKNSDVQVYVGRAFRFLKKFLEDELDVDLLSEIPKETYKTAIENLISYEERVNVAKQELEKYRIRESDGSGNEVSNCVECGENTILFPDPTSDDKYTHCFNCEEKFEMDNCARCNTPFVQDSEDEALCTICFFEILKDN